MSKQSLVDSNCAITDGIIALADCLGPYVLKTLAIFVFKLKLLLKLVTIVSAEILLAL